MKLSTNQPIFIRGKLLHIDLNFCSQSGVSHHDTIFAKIDFNVKFPPPPPHTREPCGIIKLLRSPALDSAFHLPIGRETFYMGILIIKWSSLLIVLKMLLLTFAPTKIVECCHHNAPWMTSVIKQKLKEKTKMSKLSLILVINNF